MHLRINMGSNFPSSSDSSTTGTHTTNASRAASCSDGPKRSVTAPTEVIDSPVRVDVDAVRPQYAHNSLFTCHFHHLSLSMTLTYPGIGYSSMQSLSELSQDVIHIGSWASLEHLSDTILPQEIPHSATLSPPARLRLPSDTEENRQSGHAVEMNAASREGDTRKEHAIGLLRSAMQRKNWGMQGSMHFGGIYCGLYFFFLVTDTSCFGDTESFVPLARYLVKDGTDGGKTIIGTIYQHCTTSGIIRHMYVSMYSQVAEATIIISILTTFQYTNTKICRR